MANERQIRLDVMRMLYDLADRTDMPPIDRQLCEFAGELVEATFLEQEGTIEETIRRHLEEYLAELAVEQEAAAEQEDPRP